MLLGAFVILPLPGLQSHLLRTKIAEREHTVEILIRLPDQHPGLQAGHQGRLDHCCYIHLEPWLGLPAYHNYDLSMDC